MVRHGEEVELLTPLNCLLRTGRRVNRRSLSLLTGRSSKESSSDPSPNVFLFGCRLMNFPGLIADNEGIELVDEVVDSTGLPRAAEERPEGSDAVVFRFWRVLASEARVG